MATHAGTGTVRDAALDDDAARAGRRPPAYKPPRYLSFILPGLLATLTVIIFPWIFTVWMSFHEWRIGGARSWVGLRNYAELLTNQSFIESIWLTFYFTVMTVVAPLVVGTLAAVVFHRKFPGRGLLRTLFIMPMMATPAAISLVWKMMFNPSFGVLNYLLSLVGLPPSEWVFSARTVIPSLALVEVWLWTPFVMVIVLGGLAALPSEPYEAAELDGASRWQMFWKITFPLVLPFIVVAAIIRIIDALKAFEVIYVIIEGGPGSASETINLYLYAQAFKYDNIGYASAVVVVFFAIIAVLALLLLWARQKAKMPDIVAVEPTPFAQRMQAHRDRAGAALAVVFAPLVWLVGLAWQPFAFAGGVISGAYASLPRSVQARLGKAGFALMVATLMAPVLFVFFWVISLSLKYDRDNTVFPPIFIPREPTFDNFIQVFADSSLGMYFWNSCIVSGTATLAALALGVPAGYGIAKAKANGFAVLMLISRLTPGLSYLIPLFTLFQMINLVGTVWPIAITHVVITLPIVVYVMIGFFETLPHELEEAARIDGCSIWQAFLHVALPLARPGITVGAILSFIYSWNNFIFAVVLGSRTTRTMPAAVYNMLTAEEFAWGSLAAAAIVVMAPVLILTVVIQREIVGGLASGGVK